MPPPAAQIEPGHPPRFSVVIPTYQAAGTVGAAVASALAQTIPPYEVIVVDDGSTDDLDGALAEFTDRITVIRKANGGGASALNAGLASASADFIALLDADDVYRPQRLEALTELAIARPDLDLINTDTEMTVDRSSVGRFHARTPFVADDQRQAIFWSCFLGGSPAVRISSLRGVGGFDETISIGYDWDCWLRLLLRGSRAGFVDEVHHEYRVRADSLTADRVAALWDRVRILEKARVNPFLEADLRPALARALRYHRTRAILADAESRIARGERTRSWLLGEARSRDLTRIGRLALVLAAAAPRWSRHLLRHD